MNCVCPIAPAQLPVIWSGLVSPFCRMRSASISCVSKNAARREEEASVASELMIGLVPRKVP